MGLKLLAAALAACTAVSAIAAPPPAPVRARLGALLTGVPIRILDTERGTYDHRGTVATARIAGCSLTLANRGLEPASLTTPLGDLRYVQGIPGMIEITRTAAGNPSIIFTVGEANYEEAIRLLTRAATGCGSRLVGPPPIVVTR